ncbi:MAG TPA: GNAT family N-acetyltransferase [Longimicrobium sp.]|nr:GNAT family N-acetyltransferase [Longimicrobium sp.]
MMEVPATMPNPPTQPDPSAEPASEFPPILVCPLLTDAQLNALFAASWPEHEPRAFGPVLERSLVYCAAFEGERIVGFVNVAWDGGAHAFLLDPTVHPEVRHRGLGSALVRAATNAAAERGAEWLHVDFEPHLQGFYRALSFRHTEAGLLRLSSTESA